MLKSIPTISKWSGMDTRTVEVKKKLSLISRVENNTLHLEASAEAWEYTDDPKLKRDGYHDW